MLYTMALASDIPVMIPYVLLASPAFTDTPTQGDQPVLTKATSLSPAYYDDGWHIKLDISTANTFMLQM